MEPLMYLYLITDIKHNKVYIGQTNKPKRRWNTHCNGKELEVDKAIQEHGRDNFTFDIIAICKGYSNANCLEAELIKQYGSIDPMIGYNRHPGGGAGPMPGYLKAKLSAIKKGFAPEYQRDISFRAVKTRLANPNNTWHSKGGPKKKDPALKKKKTSTREYIKRPTLDRPRSAINWPTDQELLSMVNDRGCTAVAKELDVAIVSVSRRLIRKGLRHNRLPGSPETIFAAGSNHKNAKLTEQQVLEIVTLHKTGNYLQTELAKQFGVTRSAILSILQGYNWSHLTGITRKSRPSK